MLCNERNLLKKTVAVFLNCFLTIFSRISIPAVRQIARNRQTTGEKTEEKKTAQMAKFDAGRLQFQ